MLIKQKHEKIQASYVAQKKWRFARSRSILYTSETLKMCLMRARRFLRASMVLVAESRIL